jgi:hypothetical protein
LVGGYGEPAQGDPDIPETIAVDAVRGNTRPRTASATISMRWKMHKGQGLEPVWLAQIE